MISQLIPGTYRLRIPVPGPLKNMNCYLLSGAQGWSVVDAGPNFPGCREQWETALEDLNIKFTDIKQIIITHSHIDHIGLAGWLQEQSGAVVLMSEPEYVSAQKYQNKDALHTLGFSGGMLRLGFKEEELEQLRKIVGSVTYIMQPWPEVKLLNNSSIRMGDWDWEVVLTSGHADGHVCLFNRQEGIMLSGDQVLPTISTVIQFPSSPADNPLRDYLHSLQLLNQLPMQIILPAHGEPFQDLQARIQQLYQHHEQRIQLILDCLGAHPKGVRTIVNDLFGSDLDLFNLFLATGEVLAHLLLLGYQGQVNVGEDPENGQVTYYTSADNPR